MEGTAPESAFIRWFSDLFFDKPNSEHITNMSFRRPVGRHGLEYHFSQQTNGRLVNADLLLKEGALINAAFIQTPISTKKHAGECSP